MSMSYDSSGYDYITPVVRKRWFRASTPLFFGPSDRSLTQQSFLEESDINNILRRYKDTSLLPQRPGAPIFGDFSNLPDYHTALEAVLQSDRAFASLSSDVRERFGNNPGAFVDFMSNVANLDEAISLGLAKRVEPPVADSVKAEPSEPAKPA